MKEREFLTSIIKEAAKLIAGEMDINEKDDKGDLVTNFDFAVEKFLISKIQAEYPDFYIISEEFNPDNEAKGDYFTIDPIDGTINFAHNIPLWGIQVACVKNNKTIASAIYLPRFDEMYSADETGAYLNGQPIHVNSDDEFHGIYDIATSEDVLDEKSIALRNMHSRDLWSSAVQRSWVACGKISAVLYSLKDNYIWDITPGDFLIEQAGGVIFDVGDVRIAANSKSWANLLRK